MITNESGTVFVSIPTSEGFHRAVFAPDTDVEAEIQSVTNAGISADWDAVRSAVTAARTLEVMESFNQAKAIRQVRIAQEDADAKAAEQKYLQELAAKLKAM